MDQLFEAAAGIAIAIIAFEMLLSLLPEGKIDRQLSRKNVKN